MAVAFPINGTDLSAKERVARRIRARVLAALGEPWLTRFAPEEVVPMLEDAGWGSQ